MNENDKNSNSPKNEPPKAGKSLAFILVIILLVLFLFWLLKFDQGGSREMGYSEFKTLVEKNDKINWKEVTIMKDEKSAEIIAEFYLKKEIPDDDKKAIQAKYSKYLKNAQDKTKKDNGYILTVLVHNESIDKLETVLDNKDISYSYKDKPNNWFFSALISILPWLLVFGILWFVMFRQLQGSGNKALSFGKSKARLHKNTQKKVTFDDVAGVDEAKAELQEAVEFLKNPAKFKKLGAKIPKGVLLVGPPGTGKTLLARSVAGEANRPFFSMSGSEFVEMFVGVGASRVRDLFEQGKKHSPCILFIDELDAVGRVRGAGYGGGHDEREQTLNQMLVEMDGFDTDETVIVMAATNRADVLDPALLRPGRFDRRVIVGSPDVKGREEILKIHAKKIPSAKSVNLKTLAKATPGFSGADLANLVNEAALVAARRDKIKVQMEDFEYAKDKVMMGPERKSMVLSDKEKINTAYHEAGHALLAYMLPKVDPLHKVSIIPRGNALGVTMQLPLEDRKTLSKEYLLEQMMVLFGGRIGEEYKFGNGGITNGATNDIERGTQIARAMICEWGMSDAMGPITYGQKEEPIFIGKEIARHKDYSEKTAELIDAEVKSMVENSYNDAKNLIMTNVNKLEALAQGLLEKEVLDRKEIDELIGEASA